MTILLNKCAEYSNTVPTSQVSPHPGSTKMLYLSEMSKPDTTAMAFIKKARSKMSLSQDKFGELFNCTKSNVSGWENGRHIPPYKVLRAISTASGVPLPSGLANEENMDAKVYSTPDPQKQRMIEMIFELCEQDLCDYVENSLRLSLGKQFLKARVSQHKDEVGERRVLMNRRSTDKIPGGNEGGKH